MKLIKASLAVLVCAILINTVSAYAANVSSTGIVGVLVTINAGKKYKSENWTKGTDFNVQSYDFQQSSTTITSPCPNCKFKVSLYKSNGNLIGSKTGKTGNSYYFDNILNQTSAASGDYFITIKRSGVTAVTSYHTGDWYIAHSNANAEYIV